MSLYHMVFGQNPSHTRLLEMLGVTEDQVPRYRDCFLDREGHIVIHTRTGGGNRFAYKAGNIRLTQIPGYQSDNDDSFDSTYANFYYGIPDEFKAECEVLRGMGAERDPHIAWQQLLAKLRDPSKADDPEVKAVLDKSRPLMESIEKALDNSGRTNIEV